MNYINKKSFVIFSLNTDNIENERALLTSNGLNNLKAIKGCYKGKLENSWLAVLDKPSIWLFELLQHYKQESYLYVNEERKAYLYQVSTDQAKPKYLGRFEVVPEHLAKNQDAWTFDPETKTYYVAS